MRLHGKHPSKKGYDCLIQIVILKELIDIMGRTIKVLDIELKMEISRIKYLEIKLLWLCYFYSIKMTILYLTEYNTKCYGVTYENIGYIKLQKLEDFSDDKELYTRSILCKHFWVKANLVWWQQCRELLINRYLKEILFYLKRCIGNNNKGNNKNNKHRYVFIGGDLICSFLTIDKIYKYISNMGINLTSYSIEIGWENIYFLTPHFKFV